MLTQQRLKELFRYNPETGEFTRLVHRSTNARKGDVIRGCKTPYGYLVINVERKVVMAHRLAWLYVYGELPAKGMDIDHINGDRADNRVANLRTATRSQNLSNKRMDDRNTSGVTGVSWYKAYGKWNAQIHVQRKRINLGYFESLEDAAAARRDAEVKYFGEFRRSA
jgi:hypothetical protein